MSASLLNVQGLLGLFELDDAGKILYYRMDSAGTLPGASPGRLLDMTGHNFYDEVAPFQNVDEFRRCVTDFRQGGKAADSFDFDCHCDGCNHPVRVLLARIREHVDRNHTKSILVHIRRGETD